MISPTKETLRGNVLSTKDPLKAQAWKGVGTVLSPPPLGGGGAELGRAVSSPAPLPAAAHSSLGDRRKQLRELLRSGSALATMQAAAGVLLLLLWGTLEVSQAQRSQQRRPSAAHQQRGTVQGALSWDCCS